MTSVRAQSGGGEDSDEQAVLDSDTASGQQIEEPPRYAVVLHNDDFTTMEFVVEILKRYFHKTEAEAMRVMLEVHSIGRGVAGIYSFEIAETKAAQVVESAKQQGYPLQCSVEKL